MTFKEQERAWNSAHIISFLPVEDWLDTCNEEPMRKLLYALLEVKRTMQWYSTR